MSEIRRVTGTKHPHMVCKFCSHGKTWHRNEGPCHMEDCDCVAWDYGTNVEVVDKGSGDE